AARDGDHDHRRGGERRRGPRTPRSAARILDGTRRSALRLARAALRLRPARARRLRRAVVPGRRPARQHRAREPPALARAREAARGAGRGPVRPRWARHCRRAPRWRRTAAAVTVRVTLALALLALAPGCTRSRITLGSPVVPEEAASIGVGITKAEVLFRLG